MKYYTGVGSRSTPKDIMQLMSSLAYKLAGEGYILRSGAAQGADTAFEDGCKEYWLDSSMNMCPTLAQIYIPWSSFATPEEYYKDWYRVLDRMPNNAKAYEIASQTHPAWNRCSRGAKALHARNVYQVLGNNLASPSQFLVCWAPVYKDGRPKGGTATAWNLAEKVGVKHLFNLYKDEDRKRIEEWVK